MKIIHLDTGKEWRGGQRQVLLLHQGLLGRGIESLVVAQAKGKLYQNLHDMKIPLSCRGEWDIKAAFKLAGIIKEFSPDIAHAHDAHAHTLLLLASLFGIKTKIIVSRRVDFSIAGYCWSKWKYQTPKVCKIITVSQAIKEILMKDGIPEEKITVVYSGIRFQDISREKDQSLRQQLSIPKEGKVLGCIANFADHKDHRTLLKIFEEVAKARENIYLLLVGDGPLFREIKTESQRLFCADRIIFTGYKENVYSYLLHFDIFVLTSYLEGLCTSLIDSISCGIPVVASRTGGIPEIIKDGENGFLIEVRDVNGFVNAILKLLQDHKTYTSFQENCIFSSHKFSIENTINETIKAYQKVLS